MGKLRICLEVQGIAEDKDGNPCPAGIAITVGETEKEIPYEKLAANLNIPEVLKLAWLDGVATPDDVTIITPEQYDEKYGDD